MVCRPVALKRWWVFLLVLGVFVGLGLAACNNRSIPSLVLSYLFPMRHQQYPPSRVSRVIGKKTVSRPSYDEKQKEITRCNQICKGFLKEGIWPKEDVIFTYLPPSAGSMGMQLTDDAAGNPGVGRSVATVKYNNVYMTCVVTNYVLALTFEPPLEKKAEKADVFSLKELQIILASYVPKLNGVIFEDQSDGKVLFGKAALASESKVNETWANSVYWWQEPGKFGISFFVLTKAIPWSGRVYTHIYPALVTSPEN